MTRTRTIVLTGEYPPSIGGVAGYAGQWVAHVADDEAVAVIRIVTGDSHDATDAVRPVHSVSSWSNLHELNRTRRTIVGDDADCILFHYVPHMYSPRGLPVGVVVLLLACRLTARRTRVISLLHEFAVAPTTVRSSFASVAQWALTAAIAAMSHRVVLTTPARLQLVARRLSFVSKKLIFIPISPSIALPSVRYSASRHPVVLHVGSAHPSTRTDWVREAAAQLAQSCPEAKCVVTGPTLDAAGVFNVGHVSDEELGRLLASAEVVLQPFSDGASTRRTTIVNALVAGRPVVSSVGDDVSTDYFDGCVILARSQQEFIDVVVRLCKLAVERSGLAEQVQVWSTQHVSWEVTALEWRSVLRDLSPGRSRVLWERT